MSSKLQATRARVEAQRFKGNLAARYAGKPKAEAAAGVGSGLVSVDGQYYVSDVGAGGEPVTVVNTGRPAAAQYTANTGGGAVVLATGGGAGGGGVTNHGDLTGLDRDDHTIYLTPARGNLLYPTLVVYTAHANNPDAHHAKLHGITDGTNHSVAGSENQVVGLTGTNTLGLLDSAADVSGGQSVLLRSASGNVKLLSVTVPTINTAAGNLTITAAGDLLLGAGGGNVIVNPSALLKSFNYSSKTTGWGISYAGSGDFRSLYSDELVVKLFIADLEQALAGGQIISKSVAVLDQVFTAPAAGATALLVVRDLPSASGMRTFENGDYLRLRTMSRSGGGLTVADCWGTVVLDTTYGASGFDASTKTQRYTLTRSAGTIGAGNPPGGMSAGTQIQPDAIILDYGTSGNGIVETTAIDGTWGENAPYTQTATWTGHPATGLVTRTRSGNLKGITGVAEFGFFAGSVTAGNLVATGDRVALRQGATEVIRLDSNGNSYFAGIMTIDTAGEIRQGTVTSGNVWSSLTGFTGLRLWSDTGIGRIGGYNSGVLQWYGSTDGRFYAGEGSVILDDNGIGIIQATTGYATQSALTFLNAQADPIGDVAFFSQLSSAYWRIGWNDGVNIPLIEAISSPSAERITFTAEDLFLDGNVGVGTISPATPLHVLGVARFEQNAISAQFVGSDHVYMEFYPDGVASGRKGYFGYPSAASENLTFGNQYAGGKVDFFGADTAASLKKFFDFGWTSTTAVEANLGAARNGDTMLDLISDTTNTDYGLRILRRSGTAGNAEFVYQGTGEVLINAANAAGTLGLFVGSSRRLRSSVAITVANGTTNALVPDEGTGLYIVAAATTGQSGAFLVNPGGTITVVLIADNGVQLAGSPASGKSRFYSDGAGALRLHNNTGASCVYHVTIIGYMA